MYEKQPRSGNKIYYSGFGEFLHTCYVEEILRTDLSLLSSTLGGMGVSSGLSHCTLWSDMSAPMPWYSCKNFTELAHYLAQNLKIYQLTWTFFFSVGSLDEGGK